jgi:hypothetical protein
MEESGYQNIVAYQKGENGRKKALVVCGLLH